MTSSIIKFFLNIFVEKEWGFVIGSIKHDRLLDPKLTSVTDEANSNLLRYVNSQSPRHWSSRNPQVPIYNQKTGLWCAISAHRIIELTFYEGTLDVEILHSFFFFG
jgi:hypothetical protein